jgi:uncharacterized RDD family membrane protein YckC
MNNKPQILDEGFEKNTVSDSDFIVASASKRFLNTIIDTIAFLIIFVLVNIIVTIISKFMFLSGDKVADDFIAAISGTVLFGVCVLFYLSGKLTGKSIGKFITKTRVVSENGEKPAFLNIVGRSFARLIPFEAFSFLGTSRVGFHDSLSKTRVIND